MKTDVVKPESDKSPVDSKSNNFQPEVDVVDTSSHLSHIKNIRIKMYRLIRSVVKLQSWNLML
jgi:hypothetical protein